MRRAILIIIIIVVLIAIILGIYFLVANSNQNLTKNQNPASNPSTFEVQGVKVEILKQGTGPAAKADDNVTVNYVGTLAADGKKFDSSIDRNAPFTFILGKGRVIKGWDIGILGMKVGEKRRLTIPPELAYGSTGFLNIIPKNATLIFEVELLGIHQ